MQGLFRQQDTDLKNRVYTTGMARKLSKKRPQQGARIAKLRKEAGLSQAELARLINESQQNIAFWEQSDNPPRSDTLVPMARILGVPVEHLLTDEKQKRRRGGPVGKLQRIFDEVSALPRRQQEKVIEFVAALINQYKNQT